MTNQTTWKPHFCSWAGNIWSKQEAKHTRALRIEEILKTDKTNNLNDIKDDGETSKEKLKDIPNTDKETYG